MKRYENWIKEIEKSKNIDELPLIKKLLKIANAENTKLVEVWRNQRIVIKDGMMIELEAPSYNCLNNKNTDILFYHVINTEVYICAECGLWQRSYKKFKKEMGCEHYFDDLLLPLTGKKIELKHI